MSEKVKNFRLEGYTVPPCTPFKDNGDVNYDLLDDYVQHMLDYGASNIFLTGTNGEGLTMTVGERKEFLERMIKSAAGRFKAIVAHIGCENLRNSQELARHAESAGADAISCVGPSYYKPENLESYVDYMAQVAAAAPNTPFYLYDIDFFTGITLSVSKFFDLAKDKIPTLRGVKHTSPNFVSMHHTMEDHNRQYQVILGSAELYLESLAIGVEGTIACSYLGNVLNRCKAAFEKGDLETARLEQKRALLTWQIRRKYDLTIAGGTKAILRTMGLEVGDPRLPHSPISSELLQKIKADLEKIGFFEWTKA